MLQVGNNVQGTWQLLTIGTVAAAAGGLAIADAIAAESLPLVSMDIPVGGSTEQVGTQLFRVFGNEAQGLGNYYTTVDPGTLVDYRTTAGLFPGNSGSFVLQGTLSDTDGVIFTSAAPGPGGVGGGLPEVFVPNPATQINITGVRGVNPSF
jgi:hypothetical protein